MYANVEETGITNLLNVLSLLTDLLVKIFLRGRMNMEDFCPKATVLKRVENIYTIIFLLKLIVVLFNL